MTGLERSWGLRAWSLIVFDQKVRRFEQDLIVLDQTVIVLNALGHVDLAAPFELL